MINFFRRIRRKHFSENRLRKYVLYACGEVVLVMIGILLALQVNQWNEERKRLKQERVLLSQIRDEMASQYGDVYWDLQVLNIAQNAHFRIVDHLAKNLAYQDSLCFYFDLLKSDEYIYPNIAAYSKLKDVGLDIISADTIRSGIQNLYENLYPRISRENSFTPDISEFLNDYYIDNFEPNTNYDLKFSIVFETDSIAKRSYGGFKVFYPQEFLLNGENRTFTRGYVPLEYDSLMRDSKFKMLLYEADNFRDYKIIRYEMAQEQIKQLIQVIDSTLSN